MSRLLTLGETMGVAVTDVGAPLRTTDRLRLSTAGAESTVAVGMRRLGHEATWVGVVGDDELGARVRRDLAAEGVETAFIRTDPDHPTGFMIRELRTADYTRVTYYRAHSAGAHLRPADVEAAMSADFDLLHITGITPALSDDCWDAVRCAVRLARRDSIPISFDVNYRSTLPGSSRAATVAGELLKDVWILFVGEEELAILTDEADVKSAARDLLGRGPSEVVVKRGADGALAVTVESAFQHPALPVRVLDVIGAGDSFAAGYLAARCDELPVPQRLRWGTIAAACTVGSLGDWEGLPTRGEIEHRSGGSITVR